ncbi:MAG: hypothetical protein U9N81_02260 [Bacillota bacterium]|nr:hypothetical protein [Bacillota bacterium]
MIKSRWIRIIIKILLIGLVVTGYFYLQKPTIYRYRDVNEVIPLGDIAFVIDEINVHNWDDETYRYSEEVKDFPLAYRLLWNMHIPLQWKTTLGKVIPFYSKPALSEDFETLQVYGIVVYPEGANTLTDRIHIDVHPGTIVGWSERFLNDSYNLYTSKHKIQGFDAIDGELVVVVTDTQTSITNQISVMPKWEKERFIPPDTYYRNITESSNDFLNQIRNFSSNGGQ